MKEDSFSDFGIRVSTDNILSQNIIENKLKIVHHDHTLEKIIYEILFAKNVIYK